MEPGIVRNKLSHVIARCVELRTKGHCLHPTNIMDRIEDAFGKLDMIKGSRKNNLVKIIIKDRLTTRVINHQLELIRELNPNRGDLLGVTRHFDIYTFYRYNNKDLVRDMTSGAFIMIPSGDIDSRRTTTFHCPATRAGY